MKRWKRGCANMDEQIKQLFDLDALLSFQLEVMDFEQIASKYWERAEQEAITRRIAFDRERIIHDVRGQLSRLSGSDSGADKVLVKQINDFQSLYIHGEAVKSAGEWAIIGEKLQCLVDAALLGKGRREDFCKVLATAKLLQFPEFSGIAKSEKTQKCKEELIAEFAAVARMPGKILKGKPLPRVFWAVVSLDNIDEVRAKIAYC